MRCPYCKKSEDRVLDSRSCRDGCAIRRRRECLACKRRFTTYEQVEGIPLRVVKKNDKREPFSRPKLLGGLYKACEKRPIPMSRLEEVANRIELEIYEKYEKEVPTSTIGELVMRELRELDQIAYVRFASVYREFKDVSEFVKELKPMLK